ncbi:hypothetical protein [Hankyongella ginsenosidimutans]|uniref:hypothetical protein n=1 Tax=Hankyongella ginsenosidimutans TaxID=1763828 RepID=UPI003CCC63BA
MVRKIAFRFQRRHAAHAGGGDGLAVDLVLTSPAANTPGMSVAVESGAVTI